eukprot:s2074_g6.t1
MRYEFPETSQSRPLGPSFLTLPTGAIYCASALGRTCEVFLGTDLRCGKRSMTKTINATQQSLRLLVYSLAGISVFFIVLRLLTTYVLGSPGMVTAALVLLVSLVWAAQRSQQFRAKNEQEALLMQHRAFAAEVERAWERSHANGLERRKAPNGVAVSVPSHTASSTAEGSSKKRKKKKRAEDGDEETFIVDDELEAEVVEDLEDFLEHSRLRQTLKKTADELRVSQKRKEDKKASALAPEEEPKKVPETKDGSDPGDLWLPTSRPRKRHPRCPSQPKAQATKEPIENAWARTAPKTTKKPRINRRIARNPRREQAQTVPSRVGRTSGMVKAAGGQSRPGKTGAMIGGRPRKAKGLMLGTAGKTSGKAPQERKDVLRLDGSRIP